MNSEPLIVKTFGSFSLSRGNNTVDGSSNRSKKIWLLLVYLICHRDRAVPVEELSSLLWQDDNHDVDTRGALKTLLFRVRSFLDGLGDNIGKTMILSDKGAYRFNPEIPVELDCEYYKEMIAKGDSASTDNERLEYYQNALVEYRGPFLPELSADFWVMTCSASYADAYLRTVLTTVELMLERSMLDSAIALCREAILYEPASEDLSLHLMNTLLLVGDNRGVSAEYRRISETLYNLFAVRPRDDLLTVCRQAEQTLSGGHLGMDELFRQLSEPDRLSGAFFCDFDFFKMIYRSAARSVVRNGEAYHVALFEILPKPGETPQRRSFDRSMDNLQDQLRINLRAGDTVSRCSSQQFVALFRQADYENSRLVCNRIVRSFARQFPHAPVRVDYSVRPVQPV